MKRMYAFIAALLIFLAAAFFKASDNQRQARTVGVLTLMHHPALDQIYAGIKVGLSKRNYQLGKNVKIDYQNANSDQSNLHTMAGKLINENPTVLVGITTPASQALSSQTKKIPLVLGAVTDPKLAGLVKDNNHPGGNITGVSDGAPVMQQLHLIKSFMPDLKTLGVIYTSSDISAVSGYREIKRDCKKLKIKLKSYSIANTNDLNQVSEQMLTQVDAVIVPTDNTIASAMQTLVKNADAAGKPIFPAASTMVKEGGLATYSIDQHELGMKIGNLVADILQGKKKPENTPIIRIKKGTPVVNLRQARKLHMQIPAAFLRQAEKQERVYR